MDSPVTQRKNKVNNIAQQEEEEEGRLINNQQSRGSRKTPQQELDERKQKLKKLLSWLKVKLEAFVWVGLSAYLIYYSNFFKVLYSHDLAFLGIFMITVGLNVAIAIYVAIILPYILGIKEDFDKYSPKLVYLGAISGVLSFFSLIICIWPVFGFYSPPMVFIFLLGYINTSHFLPNNQLGSILYGGVFIASFCSHLYIEHEGFLHAK